MKAPSLPAAPGLSDAKKFVRQLTRWIGPGFHPDNDISEYVFENGERCFSRTLAKSLNRDLERAADLLATHDIDICSVALPIQHAMLFGRRRHFSD